MMMSAYCFLEDRYLMESKLKELSDVIRNKINTFLNSTSSKNQKQQRREKYEVYDYSEESSIESNELEQLVLFNFDSESAGECDIKSKSYLYSEKNLHKKTNHAPILKAEDVSVNIIVMTPELSNEELDKYINLILGNAEGYILLVKGNTAFTSMPIFCNSLKTRDENKKLIKNFLSTPSLSENTFELFEIIKKVNEKSKTIAIPNMITMEQAIKEEKEYEKAREAEQKRQEEERRNREKEKENNTVSKESNLNSAPNSKLDGSGSVKQVTEKSTNGVEKTKISAITKNEPIKVSNFLPLSFKPSKPIYNPVIKNISIIGKNDISLLECDMDVFKETKKIVTAFLKEEIDMAFYSIDEKNIETLSLLGFRKIELLHEKFT